MTTLNDGLSKFNLDRLRALVHQEAGINLAPEKKTMMEIRLKRRLSSLGLATLADYCSYVFDQKGSEKELVHLIDAITTNKTDFFREIDHFDYLAEKALPELVKHNPSSHNFLFWSAGCSSGEEPYTLAMVLSEFKEQYPGFQFSILATDICTSVLEKAATGIFKSESLVPVPRPLQKKYFMRSRNHESDLVRAVPEVRSMIEFRRLNFMDSDFGLRSKPEIIFCRNVIIYFDKETQVKLLNKFASLLAPGGFFFAGHSESLQGMGLPLVPVAPSVYWKQR
jgi:chemotaxis protein methyltransferase CheR